MSVSFENSLEQCHRRAMRKCGACQAHISCDDCVDYYFDRLKEAHERELEHASKAEYHRGHEDGKRSMDADHQAVATRLRKIRFDGGSHENLNKLAYAIYPCATGWTEESCEGLRDRLIDLLGGVHECVSDGVPCDAGCDCGDSHCGESEDVGVADSVFDVRSDVPFDDGVADFEDIQVTYDALGNERHKAIAELRKLLDEDRVIEIIDLVFAIEVEKLEVGDRVLTSVCKRLIHLLGGDQPSGMDALRDSDHPTLRDLWGIWKGDDESKVDECKFSTPESYIDADDADANPAETSVEPSDHVSLDTPSTITSELRKWADARTCKGISYTDALDFLNLLDIADRIDATFFRICEQHERVLQDTIEQMADDANGIMEDVRKARAERDRLQAMLDEATAALDELHADPINDVLCKVERERDELQRELNRMTRERDYWKQANTDTMNRADDTEHELDELKRKLRAISGGVE